MLSPAPSASTRNRLLQRIILAAVVLVGIFTYLYVIRSSGPTAASNTLTVGTFSKALGNAPYYIARHFHWFEREPSFKGYSFQYIEYNDLPSITSAFARGDLQLLFSAEVPAILIRSQGEDVRIVMVSTFAAQEIVTPSASSIASIKALKGHNVTVQSGTSSHYALLEILKSSGLSSDDVPISYINAPAAQAAFEAGSLDAWAVWAPWVETQEVAGRGKTISGGEVGIYSVGTMPSTLLSQRPDVAADLLTVLQRAKQWMLEHPSDAQTIVAEEFGLAPAVVQRAWPKFRWDAQLVPGLIPDFQAKSAFLAAQKLSRNGIVVDVARDLVNFSVLSDKPK
jgi:sulfonate transport system substrate-binding protein